MVWYGWNSYSSGNTSTATDTWSAWTAYSYGSATQQETASSWGAWTAGAGLAQQQATGGSAWTYWVDGNTVNIVYGQTAETPEERQARAERDRQAAERTAAAQEIAKQKRAEADARAIELLEDLMSKK